MYNLKVFGYLFYGILIAFHNLFAIQIEFQLFIFTRRLHNVVYGRVLG